MAQADTAGMARAPRPAPQVLSSSLLTSHLSISEAAPVIADQAIFSSIRSATGSGYRLIAASAGVSTTERQELTQRCPSHASLTADGPSAEALAAWRLRSGRYCVVWSRHAGLEPTARGGYRVHSHVAIVDDGSYRRFACSPSRLHVAMIETLDAEPLIAPPAVLNTLSLPDGARGESVWLSAVGVGCRREVVFALVENLLAGRTLIATDIPSPIVTLDAVMAALPLALRSQISACVGLKFSPSRQATLTFLEGPCEQARQLTRGKPIVWLDAGALPAGGSDDWLGLMRRWWGNGQRKEFCQLAARMEDASGDSLRRLAGLCNDVEKLAKPEELADITTRYQHFKPRNALESALFARVQDHLERSQPVTDGSPKPVS